MTATISERPDTHPDTDTSACIFNIMRFATHDGPGIRTAVFFKGCPLSCWWCHNPESQSFLPDRLYFEERCRHCLDCVEVCPQHAIQDINGSFRHPPRAITATGPLSGSGRSSAFRGAGPRSCASGTFSPGLETRRAHRHPHGG